MSVGVGWCRLESAHPHNTLHKSVVPQMADVVAGVPVARGLQGKLSNEEVHDLFQNVGRGAVHPDSAHALLGSRGSTGCKQGAGQDERLVQCLVRTRRSVHDVLRELTLADGAKQRVEHARRASLMLDKAKCSRLGRGHAWRFVLHAKCKMDNSIAKHRASWLTCLCRDIGDGGLSVDGDVARAVYEQLGLEWRKGPEEPRAPRAQESWLARHAAHVEGALLAIERNRKRRRLQGAWYAARYVSDWHEALVETLHGPEGEEDSDSDALSAVCESDDGSEDAWDEEGSEPRSDDSEASSKWYEGEAESGEGWGEP